ncbi:MAG: exodeoxyribonuclease VII small subunit [Ruminococcaceae bacterium]|nr:exodeoxyribonuclease VII small subunit [Oscillospiraceae bacterium]
MATAKPEHKKNETMSFEAGLARLDEIIALLEKDGVPLDELMGLYEEGVGLLRTCNEQLESAEQRVQMLQISSDGTRAHLVPFAEEGEA